MLVPDRKFGAIDPVTGQSDGPSGTGITIAGIGIGTMAIIILAGWWFLKKGRR